VTSLRINQIGLSDAAFSICPVLLDSECTSGINVEIIISSLHHGDKTAPTTCLPNDHISPTIFDVTRATVHSARGAMKMGASRKRMAATADGDSSESSINNVNRTAPIPKMMTRQAKVAATAARIASVCDAGKEAGHSVVRSCRRW
jgi:hypothetical protein